MCLTTNSPEVKFAEKSIIVYKRLRSGRRAQHNGFNYSIGELEKEETLRTYDGGGRWTVNEGYHSYNKFFGNDTFCNYIFIIPKAARYIDGWYNSDEFVPNRVSSTIICMGHVFSPLTWLRVLIQKIYG